MEVIESKLDENIDLMLSIFLRKRILGIPFLMEYLSIRIAFTRVCILIHSLRIMQVFILGDSKANSISSKILSLKVSNSIASLPSIC